MRSLGINVIDEMRNISQVGKREEMNAGLYVDYNHFAGLEISQNIIENKGGIKIMDGIYCAVMKLLSTKMLISDDFLILCWQYVQGNNNSSDEFIESLLKCARECLTTSDKNGNFKLRSYFYFKQFLLHSNIWFAKEYKNNRLLFDYINEFADECLIKQKEFIWQNVQEEEKNDNENWNKLCSYTGGSININNSNVVLRQDRIENGIKSIRSEKEVFVTRAMLDDENGKTKISEKTDFDFVAEHNDKVYLTRAIAFAVENNTYFQKKMFALFVSNVDEPQVRQAPIKTYDRCLVKSNTDYHDRSYPSGACILGLCM